ncbi:hypothetical protein ACFROD_47310 [Streptomyces mirabilis]|uniref:hypothetical protein n=1 Tax=Streptomyces mirabilis TaxID=68239 RepID=UPI00369978C8
MGADILILSPSIWLGHASSIAQRVLERLDAEISETDDEGRMLTYGKAAAVCGRQRGRCSQGQRRHLNKTPETTVTTTKTLAANTAHHRIERPPMAQGTGLQAPAESAPRPGEPPATPALR